LVELSIAMILGSLKNECCFSTLSFLKSKLRNQLTKHLDLVVKTFAQDHYTLDSFPFGDAMKDWNVNKVRYVVHCWIFYVFY
jgi:hypothetical protein